MKNIFNIFGSQAEAKPTEVRANVTEAELTVEQVHREFFTASERILREANDILKQTQADKAVRLKNLGFENTTDVKESQDFVYKKEIAAVIQKYQMSHPLNKVITSSDVLRICAKYKLITGAVKKFKGFVPEKNLKEIEQFKIPAGFKIFEEDYGSPEIGSFETKEQADLFVANNQRKYEYPLHVVPMPVRQMLIAAPQKDMILESWEKVENHQIVTVPDPIVLYPIERQCYLIVTAWGDESSDPAVVNEKFN